MPRRPPALRELLAGLHHDLAGLITASAGANADDEHDPEGATIAFERAQLSAMIEQAETRLAELALAEHRLRDGSYTRLRAVRRPDRRAATLLGRRRCGHRWSPAVRSPARTAEALS